MYGSVFFFKQKTAYEMRISDWSSDVCSSDLECLQRSEIERRERTVPGVVGRDDAADEAILRIWLGSEFRIHGHVARVGDVPPAIIVLRVTRDSAAGSFPLLDAIMAAIVEGLSATVGDDPCPAGDRARAADRDRKSTRLNSSH